MDSVLTLSRQCVNCSQVNSGSEFCTYGIKIFLLQMEEPCRSKKFHFPGYDGALPKAMRTSWGRSAYHQKGKKQASTDLNCIELLATVAGQVLQAKTLREENVGTQRASTDGPGNTVVEDCKFKHCQDQNNIQAGLTNLVCMQNAENVQFPVLGEVNVGSCDRDVGSCDREGRSEVYLVSKGDGSTHTSTLELPEAGALYSHMHSVVLEETNADCGSFRDTNAKEEGSSMTLLRDSSPQPLSSGNSGEAPTLVHKQSCSLCSEKPLEMHLDFSQDLVCLEAKDDDDNFSDLVVPQTTLPLKLSVHSIENTRPMQLQEGNRVYQGKASVTDANIKGVITGGINHEENHVHCMREFSSHQSQGKKRRRTSKSSKICVDPYKSTKFNPVDSDTKDTSVGSSPTASEGLWRSTKKKSNEANDCLPVKVNITSFRVPELSINLPESATVANLKKAVMEATVKLLGGGLHVRVLHHGKKVYDENSTLVQMGIASCKDRLDSLAFMLEPSGASNTSVNMRESVFACSNGRNQHSTRYPVFSLGDDLDGNRRKIMNGLSSIDTKTDASNKAGELLAKDGGLISDVGECAKLQQCVPDEPLSPATAALIVHPYVEGGVPSGLVTSQQSFGKRRTRRPFTVLEVEALVQAVELLGTGRWREVKQQVFSHARHRTYVDLKDKWKTLVHTAHIAPHQRRGEPVPQELLDRVLQAHTYWAVQLAKQQEDMGI